MLQAKLDNLLSQRQALQAKLEDQQKTQSELEDIESAIIQIEGILTAETEAEIEARAAAERAEKQAQLEQTSLAMESLKEPINQAVAVLADQLETDHGLYQKYHQLHYNLHGKRDHIVECDISVSSFPVAHGSRLLTVARWDKFGYGQNKIELSLVKRLEVLNRRFR